MTMTPNPNPIPPEMPTDPSRVPPPDMPINIPPEKGPHKPEPIPPGPNPPERVTQSAAIALAFVLFASLSPAFAQRTVGRDTTTLEKPNPAQSECAQISDLDERQRCFQKYKDSHAPSGAPVLGKPGENHERPTDPSVGRETWHEPTDGSHDGGSVSKRPDPNAPSLAR